MKKNKKLTKAETKRQARIARKKALAQWSSEGRRLCPACEFCGRTEYLDANHCLAKEYYHEYELEPNNRLILCKKCHKLGAYSWHKNPVYAMKKLKELKPQQYQWLHEHVGEPSND